MATVRRYSRSARVTTEIQGTYEPVEKAQAAMMENVRSGFKSGIEFLRPAVEQEQTQRGEAEALEAVDEGSFEMRKPFTLRDGAFNETGARLVTNNAMLDLEDGLRTALKNADGSVRRLEKELAEVQTQFDALPEIPGLQTRWTEAFERGQRTAVRQTTELAERRAIAAQRQAAADAAAAAAQETERLAFTAGTPEELSAAISAGADNLAKYGPKGAFTLNGVEYPEDPSRAGIYTPRQLNNQVRSLSQNAYELYLRADLERSDAPGQWVEQFEAEVLSGNSPLPPGKSLSLLGTFEAKARRDEAAMRAEENRLEKRITEAVETGMNPYVVAQENGVIAAIPDEQKTELREIASAVPSIAQDLELQFSAADAVVAMQGMSATERVEYIEAINAQAVATPGIDREEAATINALAPYLTAARKAFTRETIGITAAEQAAKRGAFIEEDRLAEMRVQAQASDKPELVQAVEILTEAQRLMRDDLSLSGTEREELLNNLQSTYDELIARGDAVGANVVTALEGLGLAREMLEAQSEMADKNPVRFLSTQGVEIPPLPQTDDARLAQVAQVIAQRVQIAEPALSQFGVENPVPISQSEREFISGWMRDAPVSERVAFFEQLDADLPPRMSGSIMEALGQDNPEIMAAGYVRDSNAPASATILAGLGATVGGDSASNIALAETQALREVQANGFLPPQELERVREVALAYARGVAVKQGRPEINPQDIVDGFDVALGRDANGNGGLEDIGGYGVTILPPGFSGGDVLGALRRMDAGKLESLAGGDVTDAFGRTMSVQSLFGRRRGAVEALQPLAGGLYAPVDAEGGFFMTPNGPLLFSIPDLLE